MIRDVDNTLILIEKVSESLNSLATVRKKYYYSYDKSNRTFYESGSALVSLLDSTVGRGFAVGFQGFWRTVTWDSHDYLVEGLGLVEDSVRKVLRCVGELAFRDDMDYHQRASLIEGIHKLQVKVDYAAAGVLKLLTTYDSQDYKKRKLVNYQKIFKTDLPQRIKELHEHMIEQTVKEEFYIKQRYLSQ